MINYNQKCNKVIRREAQGHPPHSIFKEVFVLEAANYGILSLIPLVLTLLLAFWKKDAVFALFLSLIHI